MWLYLWLLLVSTSATLQHKSRDVVHTKYMNNLKYPDLPYMSRYQWKDRKKSNLIKYVKISKNPIAENGSNFKELDVILQNTVTTTTTVGAIKLGTLLKDWPSDKHDYYSYLMSFLRKEPKRYLNATHTGSYKQAELKQSDKNIHSTGIQNPKLSYQNVSFTFDTHNVTEKSPMTNVVNRSKIFIHKGQHKEKHYNINLFPAILESSGALGQSNLNVSVPNSTDDKILLDKSKIIIFFDAMKKALFKNILRPKRSFAEYADSKNKNINRLYFKSDGENKVFASQVDFADYIDGNRNISKAKRTVANADYFAQNTPKNFNKILLRIRPVKKSATLNRFGVHVTRQNSQFLRESGNAPTNVEKENNDAQVETSSSTVKGDDTLTSMESYLDTYLSLKEMLMGSVIKKTKSCCNRNKTTGDAMGTASLIDRWVKSEHNEKYGVSRKHSVVNVNPKIRRRYIRSVEFFDRNSPRMSKTGPNKRLLHDASGGISRYEYKSSKPSLKYNKSLISKPESMNKNHQALKLNAHLHNSHHSSKNQKQQQTNIEMNNLIHSITFLKNKLNHRVVKLNTRSQYNKLNKESDFVRPNANFELKSNLRKTHTNAYYLPISKEKEERLSNEPQHNKLKKPQLANTKLNILPQTTDFQSTKFKSNEKKQIINIQPVVYQPNDKAIEETKMVSSALNNVIGNIHGEENNTENIYVSNLNLTSEEEAPNQNNNNTAPIKTWLADIQHKEKLNTKVSDRGKNYVNDKFNEGQRCDKFKSEFCSKKPQFIEQNVQNKRPQNAKFENIKNRHIEPYKSEDKKLIEFENSKIIGNANKVKQVAKRRNNKKAVERLIKQDKMTSKEVPPKTSQHTKRELFGIYMFDNPIYFDQSDDHNEVDVDMGNVGLGDDLLEQAELSDEENRIADVAKPYISNNQANIYKTEKSTLMHSHFHKVSKKPRHKYTGMHGIGTAPRDTLFSKNGVSSHPESKPYHESQKYNKKQKNLGNNPSFEKPFQEQFHKLHEDASAMQIYAEEFNLHHLKKRVKLQEQEETTQKEKTTPLQEPDDYHDEVKHIINSEHGVYRHDLHGENSDYSFKKIEEFGYSKHKPFEYSQPDDYLDDIPGDNNIENFRKVEDLTTNDRGVHLDFHDNSNLKYQKLKHYGEDEYNELDKQVKIKTPKNTFNSEVVRNWQKEIPKPRTKIVNFPEVLKKPKILTKSQRRKFIVVSPKTHSKLNFANAAEKRYANEKSQTTATTEWEVITESSLFEKYEEFLKKQAESNVATYVPETTENPASAASTMAKIEIIPTRVSFPVKPDKKASFYEKTFRKPGKNNEKYHKINKTDVNRNTFQDDYNYIKVHIDTQTPSEVVDLNEPSDPPVFIHTLRGEKRKNSAHDSKHIMSIWSKNHEKAKGDTIAGGVPPLNIWHHKGLHRPKPTDEELPPEEVEFDVLRKKRENRGLVKPSRLMCCVLKRADQQALVKHVKATWGKRCNLLVFASTHGVDQQSHWEYTKTALHFIFFTHFNDADWFLKADINTYVIVENLKYMVEKQDSEMPLYFSRPSLEEHNSFVLSKEALRRLVTVGAESESCRAGVNGSIGSCLQYIGVDAVDTRDSHMRARFYPRGPFDFNSTQEYPNEEGLSCWSDYAVAFNNIRFQDMYIMEFLLYNVQPYNISKEVVDNVRKKLVAEASSDNITLPGSYRFIEKNKSNDAVLAPGQSKASEEVKANDEAKANYGNEDIYDMSADDKFNANYEKDFDDVRDVIETSATPATISYSISVDRKGLESIVTQPNFISNTFLKKN